MSSDPPASYCLKDVICDSRFDVVVTGLHSLTGLSVHSTGRRICSRPSLATKLGHSLKKCVQMKIGIGIKEEDSEIQREAHDFLSLHTSDWQDSVSSVCTASFRLGKINRVTALPEKADVDKLKQFQIEQTNID